MVVFEAKVVVFVKSCRIQAEVVVFGYKMVSIRTKRLCSERSGCIRVKNGCIREKVVAFGQKWL